MKPERQTSLVDVFVQRSLASADPHDREWTDSSRVDGCLVLHGIRRRRSYITGDGTRVLWHFRAPDAESLRMALRVAGIDYDELWTSGVRSSAGAADVMLVVERSFEHPIGIEQERRCRAGMRRRLQSLGMEPARTVLSRCRRRLLWLCRTTTPEAVAAAESELKTEGFGFWYCDKPLEFHARSHAPFHGPATD
ncbi:MAG: hypothetical protein PVJ33_00740 [Lysobacterales bacterium]|jgi:hypothetical protein